MNVLFIYFKNKSLIFVLFKLRYCKCIKSINYDYDYDYDNVLFKKINPSSLKCLQPLKFKLTKFFITFSILINYF